MGALCIPIFVLLRSRGMQWRTASRGLHALAATVDEVSQEPGVRDRVTGKQSA